MDALSQYLAMGGYAQYVWPAYGLVAVVLIGVFAESRRGLAQAQAALSALDRPASDGTDTDPEGNAP